MAARTWMVRVAVGLLILAGTVMLAVAVASGEAILIPGAAVAFCTYVALGIPTVLGRTWARWTLFVLILLTAVVCAGFSIAGLLGTGETPAGLHPSREGVALFYVTLAACLSLGRSRSEGMQDVCPS